MTKKENVDLLGGCLAVIFIWIINICFWVAVIGGVIWGLDFLGVIG